jgi:hypothetical protein
MPCNASLPRSLLLLVLALLSTPVALRAEGEPRLAPRAFARAELTEPAIAKSEPIPDIAFPGSAYSRGLMSGRAVVSVLLDASGHLQDQLVIATTDKAFADALLAFTQQTKYQARTVRGTPVASRFDVAYDFLPHGPVLSDSMAAAERKLRDGVGGQHYEFEPVYEEKLDAPLEWVQSSLAYFPKGYKLPEGASPDVVVSFLVDETGRARIPQVEYAADPVLVENATRAAQLWTFREPRFKGKPCLVFALRVFRMRERPIGNP